MSQLKIRDRNNPNNWYSIPAGGVGVPVGGNAGDVLTKSSGTDYDTEWAAPSSGSGWTTLYSGETTEEAIIQIPITNISVKAVEVSVFVPAYANDFTLYVPLMQDTGTHYDKSGYTRAYVGITKNTNAMRAGKVAFDSEKDVPLTGMSYFETWQTLAGTQSNIQRKFDTGVNNMTPGMTITALSVATWQNTPAGTKIIVRGK